MESGRFFFVAIVLSVPRVVIFFYFFCTIFKNMFYLCAQLPYLRILDRQASPVGAFLFSKNS